MEYELNFLKALILTVTVETAVLFVLFHTIIKTDKPANGLLLLTGVAPTLATLPYLWFIFPLFIQTKPLYNIICEGSAVLVESIIILGLLKVKYPKALLISFICNMASYLIGLLIRW